MMGRPFPLVSVGKAAAATVIVVGLMWLLFPVGPLVFVPFLPLPVAYVTAKYGWSAGMVATAIAAVLVYLPLGADLALLTFLLAVGTGMTLGWALRDGWRFSRSLAVMSGALLAAFLVYGIVQWLGFGVTLTGLQTDWNTYLADFVTASAQAGLSSATAQSLADSARDMIGIVPYLAPGLLGMLAVLISASAAGLAYLIFPRLRRPQFVRMSLSGFRMHWGVAYVSIVGLALLLFTRGGEGWRGPALYAGIDLLMISQTLFFVQALGVLSWLWNSRKWRSGPRVFAFISAVVAQIFQFTGLIGLLDTWIDYRKRFALKSSGPGSV